MNVTITNSFSVRETSINGIVHRMFIELSSYIDGDPAFTVGRRSMDSVTYNIDKLHQIGEGVYAEVTEITGEIKDIADLAMSQEEDHYEILGTGLVKFGDKWLRLIGTVV